MTGDTVSTSVNVLKSSWADTLVFVSIMDLVGWASFTSLSVGVVERRRLAGTVSSSVVERKISRTLTFLALFIPDVIGWATFTVFSGRVIVFGRVASAIATGIGVGVVRTADLFRSGGIGMGGTDTGEESAVKDHTLGAARKVSNLHVRQSLSIAQGDECQQHYGDVLHKIF